MDISRTVVMEVAAALDVRPESLDQTLNDAIDPDALEQLFADRGRHTERQVGQVEFAFAGCQVTVRSSGEVSVTPEPERRTPRA